jgi:2-polyprenyl-6-methoxyphenol hydroxylase-like FAD-dependent oxidoreductase
MSVGDAVCTTTPLAGRGVALGLMQARELVRILDLRDGDITTATMQFNSWCTHTVRPRFDDHRYIDIDRMRRWSGGDVDVSRRLPSDLIVAAAQADPALKDLVEAYTTMDAPPSSLAPAQARAREIYAGGRRPRVPDGPTRERLSSVVSRTPAAA